VGIVVSALVKCRQPRHEHAILFKMTLSSVHSDNGWTESYIRNVRRWSLVV